MIGTAGAAGCGSGNEIVADVGLATHPASSSLYVGFAGMAALIAGGAAAWLSPRFWSR
jgi:hypothetical protein